MILLLCTLVSGCSNGYELKIEESKAHLDSTSAVPLSRFAIADIEVSTRDLSAKHMSPAVFVGGDSRIEHYDFPLEMLEGECLELERIVTGCGCTQASLSTKHLCIGTNAKLNFSVSISPRMSVAKKEVGIALIFKDGSQVGFNLPLRVFPEISVVSSLESHRSSLDAGEINTSVMSEGGDWQGQIELAQIELVQSGTAVTSNVSVAGVQPSEITASLQSSLANANSSNPLGLEGVSARYFNLVLAGKELSRDRPAIIDIQVVSDGKTRLFPIHANLRTTKAILCSHRLLVLNPDRAVEFSVYRSDRQPFSLDALSVPEAIRLQLIGDRLLPKEIQHFEITLTETLDAFRKEVLTLTDHGDSIEIPLVLLPRKK